MSDFASKHPLLRWTDASGQEWACNAYDHGPMCRACQPVDDTLRAILRLVDDGDAELGVDMRFQLTEKGQARVRNLIHRIGGDPDDAESTLAATRNDIAKNN